MTALRAIPYHAPAETATHGYLQSPDWWVPLAYGVVALLALCCVPGQMRESIKALWAPVGAFLRRLYVPWLWGGLFVWSAFSGAFLAPFRVLESIFRVVWSWGRERLRRLAYPGFDRPIVI